MQTNLKMFMKRLVYWDYSIIHDFMCICNKYYKLHQYFSQLEPNRNNCFRLSSATWKPCKHIKTLFLKSGFSPFYLFTGLTPKLWHNYDLDLFIYVHLTFWHLAELFTLYLPSKTNRERNEDLVLKQIKFFFFLLFNSFIINYCFPK